ncbi:MAG: DUF3127 domain-containing protein [Bacteroidales bacterium]|nr:DUF3127 domain-containing protein [Bacteroidales bacterium]MBQ8033804.1 DUF3127 domain-containing protein [Bacteroidales bacterium]
MAIDIKCRLVGKLQVQNGNSARGAWCKQDFIVETIETYPRKICMNVWGEDKVAELSGYNIGENLTISVNIESREFNGRWYTDVRAWRIQRESAAQNAGVQGAAADLAADPFIGAGTDGDDEGDLPF